MSDFTNTYLANNYRRTFPSSTFGTRELKFYAVYTLPNQIDGIPFPVTFLGNEYTEVYVGSNSYITFGDGTSNYSFSDDPTMNDANLPAILISENDNSYQYVYTSVRGRLGYREYRIRYEGRNTNGSDDGPANKIWEFAFYEDKPGIIDMFIIKDAQNDYGSDVSGITDGTNWVDGRSNHFVPWGVGSWRINALGATATVVPGPGVPLGDLASPFGAPSMNGVMDIIHYWNHDTGGASNNYDEDDDYVLASALEWAGSDFALTLRAIQETVELYFIGSPRFGMGIDFVIGVAADTDPGSIVISNELSRSGITNDVLLMTVGSEAIYVA
jgi:hypothetical protein